MSTYAGLVNRPSEVPVGFRLAVFVAVGTVAFTVLPSEPSAAAVSGAPTNVSVTPGNGYVDASWTAPIDLGDPQLIEYRVVASPSGRTCTATAPATTCRVLGTPNGIATSVTVRAWNGEGLSLASTPSRSVTPGTKPGAIKRLPVKYRKATATLRWRAPSATGGVRLTRYEYRVSSNGGRTWRTWVRTSRTTMAIKRKRKVNYRVQVRAVNVFGPGPAVTQPVRPY